MTLLSLTREEAASRAELLEVERYDIAVDLTGLLTGDRFASSSTIRFRSTSPGASTFVDCAGEVTRAVLNGTEIPLGTGATTGGRLGLSNLGEDNVLVIDMHTDNTASGEGILRTVDSTDDLVYIWTSLEPDEARRVWACFDQPDLKAPHGFVVTAPKAWTVTSNSAPTEIVESPGDPEARVWRFADTPRLSTYVAVVNAGPFHEVRRPADGYDLGFLCRQSLKEHLDRDLDEMVTLTRQGLAFFGEQFGVRFPQERYDQVFVPNLGGAMENWGCVTYGDGQLYRTPPSPAQRGVRAEFILHEMAHMWFGDLVTMRWWDDLWLNEAFASWASNWAMARATEFDEQWANFLAAGKRTAYEQDLGPASHPIRGEVANVAGAMANFDAITYIKGQSVLHQLAAYIGEEAFVAGLQDYFSRHAWSNTVLDDLMSAFGRAAGRDLGDWTRAWLDRAGTDLISLEGNTLRLTSPDDSLNNGAPRPHRLNIATFAAGITSDANGADGLVLTGVTEVELSSSEQDVDLPTGDLRLVNAGDLTFANVQPDPTSLGLMLDRVADLPDALSRALVLGTANQLLMRGELAPRDAVRAVARALPRERSAAIIEPMLALGLSWADRWAAPEESPALVAAYADAVATLVEVPEHRQVALRSLANSATTDEHLAILDEAVASAVDNDLAWRTLTRRAELGHDDDADVQQLIEADPDPDAHMRRLGVLAARPDVEAKEEVWRAFFVDYSVPAGRETLILGATFWRPAQSELLAPFARRYLEELPNLKGGLLNQGVVIRAMYPLGVGDADFVAAARGIAESDTVSAYASNALRNGSFVMERILAARQL